MTKTRSGRGAVRTPPPKAPRKPIDWDELISRVPWRKLSVISAAIVILMAGWLGRHAITDWFDRPLIKVEVQGEFVHLKRESIEGELNKYLGKSFLGLDLEKVKLDLEQHPWIYSVAINRKWPNALFVRITEQQPVARWNHQALLNAWGERFEPQERSGFELLPALFGDDSQSEIVLRQYVDYKTRMGRHGIELTGLKKESRGAWTLFLPEGVQVLLGRQDEMARMDRFLVAYDRQLASRLSEIKAVDARYTNGVSVQWLNAEKQKETHK